MKYIIEKLKPFGVALKAKGSISIDEVEIEILRKLFIEEQLVLLRGFKTFNSSGDFSNYCEKWGEVSVWPFGKILELKEHLDPKDHIFDNSYIPLHWDGMYRPQIPEYQLFHCVKAPLKSEGGRTTFTNTSLVLKSSTPEHVKLWSKVEGHYKRRMEFYDSVTFSPIITKHPHREYSVIRFNEPHLETRGELINPVEMKFKGLRDSEQEQFHSSIREALYCESNFYAHTWEDGDVVIADNFTLLHGREKFKSKSLRHIQRVQVLSNPPFDNPGLESYK